LFRGSFLHAVLRLSMTGAIPLLHLCDFMAWAVTISFTFHDYQHENPKSIVRKKEIF
jgi:hypothetical protein